MRKMDERKLKQKISEMLVQDIENANIAGAAVMVFQGGALLCDIRKGYKDIRTKEPLSRDAFFRLASMTKPITAVAALIGVQNGWFSLTDKVSDHFPSFSEMYIGMVEDGKVVPRKKAEKELCLYHLLSHSGGILCGETGEKQMEMLPVSAFKNIHTGKEAAAESCLAFEPGEGAAYSAYQAFDVIACLLEEKSGLSYPAFLEKYLFEPLSILDITYSPSEEQWGRMVSMHDRAEGNSLVTVDMERFTFERFPLSYTCAGAGLAGTIEAYSVFAEMLQGKGTFKGICVLKEEYIKMMSTPYVPMGTPGLSCEDSWGLGVRVAVNNSILPAGSFGWSGAYGTHFWIDPVNQITAIYMKNNRWHESHGCGRTGKAFEKIVMECLG